METPLDLELDLAAQKTKLDLLQSDIGRLKAIQTKLVDAKAQGDQQETWLQDHAYLESLLSKVTYTYLLLILRLVFLNGIFIHIKISFP